MAKKDANPRSKLMTLYRVRIVDYISEAELASVFRLFCYQCASTECRTLKIA